jgi:hypothetical protein
MIGAGGDDDDDWDWAANAQANAEAAKDEQYLKDFAQDLPAAIKEHERARGQKSGDQNRLQRQERDKLLAEAAARVDPTNTMPRKVVAHQLRLSDPTNFSSPNLEKLIARVRPRGKSK